jgi:membrane-bound lytic murein transglycosylase MltF
MTNETLRRVGWAGALFAGAGLVLGCDRGPVSAAETARAGTPEPRPEEVPPQAEVSVQREATPPAAVEERLRVDRSDLPALLAQRRIRVLVPYARPFFFFEEAEPRGISCELFREFGRFLEEREGLRSGDLEMLFVPCELGSVLPWLNEGYGDVGAAALTVTPERAREVTFTAPLVKDVSEIVVTSSSARTLERVEDLAGLDVWVVAGSSYAEHLRALSEDFEARGLEPMQVRETPLTLATEDLFEMVHAGILELTVCDAYKAELWAEVLDGLVPRSDLVIHSGGSIAWAVRPENPELLASLDAFVAEARQGTLLGNVLIKRYFDTVKWIENPLEDEAQARMDQYAGWIRELAEEYRFDWLRIAAQCFQESGLDPNAVSSSGAVGLMQLLPATAADMGCDDPRDPEQNLRAGVRYLDWLRSSYFDDPELDEVDRMDLILAAYNAGPGNVRKWRQEAPARGLDPNRWRENVERLALEHVGVQPIRYVDNIEKYYVAYTLSDALATEREEMLRGMIEGR